MTEVETRTQIAKLAHLLGVETTSLMYLQRLGAESVAELRNRLSDELFDGLAPVFRRISRLAPLVPNTVIASVALTAVPPEVAGRAAGAMALAHRNRIGGVLHDLTPQYMAEAVKYIAPRVIPVVANEIGPDVLIPTAGELLRRGDFLTASEFVEHAPVDLMITLAEQVDDAEGLIRTVALMSSTDRIDAILRGVPLDRLISIAISASNGDEDAVLAALTVLSRLDPVIAAPLAGEVFDRQDIDAVGRTLSIAFAGDHVPELLDALAHLDEDALARIALTDIVGDEAFRQAVGQAADRPDRRRTWECIQEAIDAPREPVR